MHGEIGIGSRSCSGYSVPSNGGTRISIIISKGYVCENAELVSELAYEDYGTCR
jgi:hypothetical protein